MPYCSHCMTEVSAGLQTCPACGAALFENRALEHHLPPGTRLKGRFLIGDVLGEGGFGITYIARDLEDGSVVAIKEYYPRGVATRNGKADPSVRPGAGEKEQTLFENGKTKFLKEAQTLALLTKEPGIVQVRYYFQCNNTAYIVMEFLRGQTLRDYLKQHGTFSAREAYGLLLPIMRSLSKVHKKDVIHRDISPDNIMLAQNGVKLLDFGAARESFSQNSRELTVMMKPGYTPEEQYSKRGKQGPWTDVYALCATIYKCITGKTPLDAISRRTETLQLPSEVGARIEPAFETVLMKGLAVHPEDRYQTIDALMADLDRCVGPRRGLNGVTIGTAASSLTISSGAAGTVAPAPDGSAADSSGESPDTAAGAAKKNRRNTVGTVLSIVFAVCVAALSVVLVLQYRNLSTTSADLSSAVSENASLQDDLAAAIGKRKSDAADLKATIQSLQDENAALQETVKDDAKEKAALENENESLSDKNTALESQVEDLKAHALTADEYQIIREFHDAYKSDKSIIPATGELILNEGGNATIRLRHTLSFDVNFYVQADDESVVSTCRVTNSLSETGKGDLYIQAGSRGITKVKITNDANEEVVEVLVIVVSPNE